MWRQYSGSTDADYARIVGEIAEATQGKGVDVVFDTVGGPLFEPCLRTLGQLGRQVNITSTGTRKVTFRPGGFLSSADLAFGIDDARLDTVASRGNPGATGPVRLKTGRCVRPPCTIALRLVGSSPPTAASMTAPFAARPCLFFDKTPA